MPSTRWKKKLMTENKQPKRRGNFLKKKKKYKSLRKQIQEKLIKFATRVPIFMYLTDYRERCLKDVDYSTWAWTIQKSYRLVMSKILDCLSARCLTAHWWTMRSINSKRYEDASLGIHWHRQAWRWNIGLYDTVLSTADYHPTFENIAEKVWECSFHFVLQCRCKPKGKPWSKQLIILLSMTVLCKNILNACDQIYKIQTCFMIDGMKMQC